MARVRSDSDSPHYHGHRQRLRDRFLGNGLTGFANHEIVELLLTLCIPRRDVKSCAKQLLNRFGSLREILDAPISELKKVGGIGDVAPVALRILRETANLYLQQKAEDAIVLESPDSLKTFWRSQMGSLHNEVFEVAYLDSAYRLMRDGIEVLEEGTVDRAAVYPRRLLEAALHRGAYGLVVAHNHPNGNVAPSEQDKILTKALVLAAAALQVKIVDHLIVSSDHVFSFREAGLL
jgi:DNA repair protein RadC